MISRISSSLSSAGSASSGSSSKLAELNKHVSTLKQQLTQAQKSKPQDIDSSVKANSITQEIVSVEAQIERLALEAQLAKLTSANVAKAQASNGRDGLKAEGHDADASKNENGNANANANGKQTPNALLNPDADPYQDKKTRGTHLNVKA